MTSGVGGEVPDSTEFQEKLEASVLETCTIVTTEANETVAPLHDRMPVIVARDDYSTWLDKEIESPSPLRPILAPYPADEMAAYPVTKAMGSSAFGGPECIVRVEAPSLFG